MRGVSRRIWQIIAIAIGVLALMEGLVRIVAHRVPPPSDWHFAEVEDWVADMETLQAAGVTSDVVVTGNSLVQRIRVHTLEEELDSVSIAHNLSLFNAHAPVQRRWLLEEVVPRLKPDRVIWGVSSMDFNGGRETKEIDRYEHSRAGRVGLTGPIDRWLARMLMTARYRQELRGPLIFAHLLDPPRTAETTDTQLDGLLERPEIAKRERTPELLAALRDVELVNYYIGEREADDFVFTIKELQKRGIDVVVILMPVPPEYIVANNEERVTFDEWREWVTTTCATLGVPVIDHSTAMPDEYFIDYLHLGAEGADIWTDLVVEDLQRLGW